MEPITIRLEDERVERLDEEAEERGFANRASYLRWILRNRNSIDENLVERLNEHDERIEALQQRIESLED